MPNILLNAGQSKINITVQAYNNADTLLQISFGPDPLFNKMGGEGILEKLNEDYVITMITIKGRYYIICLGLINCLPSQ